MQRKILYVGIRALYFGIGGHKEAQKVHKEFVYTPVVPMVPLPPVVFVVFVPLVPLCGSRSRC